MNLKPSLGRVSVVSCSDVTLADRQKIIDTIPASIRRFLNNSNNDDMLSDADEIGLFESLERHVYDENLRSRFRARLAEFRLKDKEAFNVYIMACYVQRCQTIVSFDMIYMFINMKNKDYKKAYDIVGRIDDFLKSEDLEDDPHQDYFSVRSSALARIAFHLIPDSAFGEVFDRFHKAVPASVIPDYAVFKRYAYDNDFAVRAYSDVKEGKRFYERLISTTESPFDYAHGAVYLSKMRSFTGAFSWIEKAISLSRERIFSIRNSHARILFESNIGIAQNDKTNTTAKNGLTESLSVLDSCIESDPRRSYHIMRFGDQCVQYFKVYRDKDAEFWLQKAKGYLEEALREAAKQGSRENYNRPKYRRILSNIEKVLPLN